MSFTQFEDFVYYKAVQ